MLRPQPGSMRRARRSSVSRPRFSSLINTTPSRRGRGPAQRSHQIPAIRYDIGLEAGVQAGLEHELFKEAAFLVQDQRSPE